MHIFLSVQKPIYNLLVIQGMMSGEWLRMEGNITEDVTVYGSQEGRQRGASRGAQEQIKADSWSSAILVAVGGKGRRQVRLDLRGLPTSPLHYLTSSMSDSPSHSVYHQWQDMGRPGQLSLLQAETLAAAAELRHSAVKTLPAGGAVNLTFLLPSPSLLLVHLCSPSLLPPPQPYRLTVTPGIFHLIST